MPLPTFNGAATFQLRIVRIYGYCCEWRTIPSMEPQLFSCGLPCPWECSNWNSAPSMEPQLFSCGLHLEFDGLCIVLIPSMEPQLFSCGLRCWVGFRRLDYLPSMEPQLFSCGLRLQSETIKQISCLQWSRNFSVADCSETAISASTVSVSFNGAATFQLRIACECCSIWSSTESLQWSRNFSVADWWSEPRATTDGDDLQWSRNFSVADWWG